MDMILGRGAHWPLILAFLLTMLVGGCVVKKDSPAPGCVEHWGPAPMGGCFGTTAILDLKVVPENECLEIAVNNCNGGVVEVSNFCAQILILKQVTIHPSERNVGLDVERQNDEYALKPTDSNFSDYIPAENEFVEVTGMLGGEEVKISFLKTKELC
jgi:hypothetical protein